MRDISEYTLKKATEHIYYEVLMFFETMNLLTKSNNQISTNILLDAYAIHCRTLFDFLYPKSGENKAKKDDILVFDYVLNKKLYNQKKIAKSSLKFITRKADKQVAHLTYSRNRYGKKNKPWPFIDIGKKMHESLSAFYEATPESYRKWPNLVELKNVLDKISFT